MNSTRREWLAGSAASLLCLQTAGDSFAADPAEITTERLTALKGCEKITAAFWYYGDQDKPFYQVSYVYGEPVVAFANSFDRATEVERDAMHKLLDALAKDGFLAAANDISTKDIKAKVGYSLTITAKKKDGGEAFKRLGWQSIKGDGHVELYQPLGWDLRMIERLEAIQPALEGAAAKDMQFLLGRLTGLKAQWQKER